MGMTLPTDSKTRKGIPLARGCLDYFPDALAAVAALSEAGNAKHNAGQPLHWSREKSSDHADCILRHLIDRGTVDPEDGILHDVKVAWRALAMCQLALEKAREPHPVVNIVTSSPVCGVALGSIDPAGDYAFVKTSSVAGPATTRSPLVVGTGVADIIIGVSDPHRVPGGMRWLDADGSSSIPEFLKKHKE